MIRSLTELADADLNGRRVFVRVDLNVPLTPARGVADDSRIRAALPTITYLIKRGARILLASHLGRPKGPTPTLSLEPVAARLAQLLEREVILTDEAVGDGARKVVADLREGDVALLENLRFFPGEEANDEGFARKLADYADVYVNDAFGAAHRAHASTVGMVKLVGQKAAGLLLMKEIDFLGRLLGPVGRPYLAVIGGAKVSDKIGVLENLLSRVDAFLIGGAMATTFLKAQGATVGRSKIEEDKLALARAFLKRATERHVSVVLPVDVVAAASVEATTDMTTLVRAAEVPADLMALDIGPESAAGFADRIASAKTVFWNGPMGVFERPPFAAGTLAIARAIAECKGLSVVGGGDSVAALHHAQVAHKIGHVSTGGGASLEFIEGKMLPGIQALEITPTPTPTPNP